MKTPLNTIQRFNILFFLVCTFSTSFIYAGRRTLENKAEDPKKAITLLRAFQDKKRYQERKNNHKTKFSDDHPYITAEQKTEKKTKHKKLEQKCQEEPEEIKVLEEQYQTENDEDIEWLKSYHPTMEEIIKAAQAEEKESNEDAIWFEVCRQATEEAEKKQTAKWFEWYDQTIEKEEEEKRRKSNEEKRNKYAEQQKTVIKKAERQWLNHKDHLGGFLRLHGQSKIQIVETLSQQALPPNNTDKTITLFEQITGHRFPIKKSIDTIKPQNQFLEINNYADEFPYLGEL